MLFSFLGGFIFSSPGGGTDQAAHSSPLLRLPKPKYDPPSSSSPLKDFFRSFLVASHHLSGRRTINSSISEAIHTTLSQTAAVQWRRNKRADLTPRDASSVLRTSLHIPSQPLSASSCLLFPFPRPLNSISRRSHTHLQGSKARMRPLHP